MDLKGCPSRNGHRRIIAAAKQRALEPTDALRQSGWRLLARATRVQGSSTTATRSNTGRREMVSLQLSPGC